MTTTKPIRVVVIGAGISGIGQAIRLKEELGDRVDIRVFEKNDQAGGVWYTSRWPGAGVDVPAHFYALYSDLKPDWERKYALREDVWHYWQALMDKYKIRDCFTYNTTFLSSHWNEDEQYHTVELEGQDGFRYTVIAEVLVAATGPLCAPVIPKIPGLSNFKGASFHNLEWDDSVTFEGKRVAVVGNGSSGVQMVPGLSEKPGIKLTHFIRSGGYFFPKQDYYYGTLTKWIFSYIPGTARALRLYIFFTSQDPWFRNDPAGIRRRQRMEKALLLYLKQEAPSEYLDALTPTFELGCKRTACDAGWLRSLHKENVELTNSHIVSANEDGLFTEDGRFHPLDVIIWATGADIAHKGAGHCDGVHGENNVELSKYWESIGGPESLLGLGVPGFPNYFFTIGPNGCATSWGYSSAVQTAVIARMVREMVDFGITSLQPHREAFRAWNIREQEILRNTTLTSTKCFAWFKVKVGGKVTGPSGRTGSIPLLCTVQLWKDSLYTDWKLWNTQRKSKRRLSSDKSIVVQVINPPGKFTSLVYYAAVLTGVAATWPVLNRIIS